jgi:hypothetical protein
MSEQNKDDHDSGPDKRDQRNAQNTRWPRRTIASAHQPVPCADLAAGELALVGGQSLGGYVETGVGAAVLGQERAPGTLVGEAVRQVATGVAQRREQLGAAEAMELENSCTQSPARMPIGCCQSRLPAITPRIGSTGPG